MVDKCNSNFIKFFNNTIKENKEVESGCYIRGDSSEMFIYLDRYYFLINSMSRLSEYVLENLTKKIMIKY